MKARTILMALGLTLFFSTVTPVFANQPITDQHTAQVSRSSDPYELYGSAMPLGDPTFSSYTVFGNVPVNGILVYYFVPQKEDTIPIDLMVPAKEQNASFLPSVSIIGKYVANGAKNTLDIPIPVDYESVTNPFPANKTKSFDLLSLQMAYRGLPAMIHIIPGQTYFLLVYDPASTGGSFGLHVGAVNNFSYSVKDTVTPVDTNSLVFENYPSRPITNTPPLVEQKFFPEQKTPFQTLDSQIRLWTDLLGFYLNRIPAILTNQ